MWPEYKILRYSYELVQLSFLFRGEHRNVDTINDNVKALNWTWYHFSKSVYEYPIQSLFFALYFNVYFRISLSLYAPTTGVDPSGEEINGCHSRNAKLF